MSKTMQCSYVNAGGLLFFSEGVPGLFVDDTLSSILAFQLSASSKHDKFYEAAAWQQVYFNAMTTFGYRTLRRDVRSIPVEGQGSVWDLVKHSLNHWVSTALIQQAGENLLHLQGSNGEEFEFFGEYSTHNSSPDGGLHGEAGEPVSTVSLQLAFVDAEPVVTQVFLTFKTTPPVAGLPFAQLLGEGCIADNLELTVISAELDDHYYNRFRGGLLEKLGPLHAKLIHKLEEVELGSPMRSLSESDNPEHR